MEGKKQCEEKSKGGRKRRVEKGERRRSAGKDLDDEKK